jgi:hypothetical protein
VMKTRPAEGVRLRAAVGVDWRGGTVPHHAWLIYLRRRHKSWSPALPARHGQGTHPGWLRRYSIGSRASPALWLIPGRDRTSGRIVGVLVSCPVLAEKVG